MDHFQRRDGILCAEDITLDDIANRFGTPTYVYSRATISRHVRVLQQGLEPVQHLICYAVKANANLAVLQILDELGCGFDAVSIGELARVAKAGAAPERTIMSGVGKTDDEIAAALRAGVLFISVESAAELEAVEVTAASIGCQAAVSIRVNPDVDAKTHPYIATGLKQNKFGVALNEARALFARAVSMAHVEPVSVTCHIGSQITELEPFIDAAQRMATLVEDLRQIHVPLRYVGMGGGLGVPYTDEQPPAPDRYGKALTDVLGGLGLTLVVEPGRLIVGNAGILLTRVIRRKRGADRNFVLVDAGMNDLLRPALYDASHQIVTIKEPAATAARVDIVGPVCETGDTFARDIELGAVEAGDLLAIRTAGAYGFVMASTYNGRPRPAEVLVDGDQSTLIRRREEISDLWRGEQNLLGEPWDASLPAALTRE